MQKKKMFSVVFDEYLLFANNKQKESTLQALAYNSRKHILPYFKNMFLEDITSKDIYKWEELINKNNYTYHYKRNLYYMLSGFFTYCSNFYDFNKSVITKVGCFKKGYEKDKSDFYSIDEFNAFINCVDEEIYKQFFNLMFFCGTRPGEAMALKFSDLKDGYIDINKTISTHGKRVIGTPKTASSIRKIIIDKRLNKDLINLHNYYINKYGYDVDFFIFGGLKPLSSTSINRRKEKACIKANLRPITLHQFRHSSITYLATKNLSQKEVSRRVGHAKIETTLNYYTHTDLAQEKRVFDTLNSTRNKLEINNKLKQLVRHIIKR